MKHRRTMESKECQSPRWIRAWLSQRSSKQFPVLEASGGDWAWGRCAAMPPESCSNHKLNEPQQSRLPLIWSLASRDIRSLRNHKTPPSGIRCGEVESAALPATRFHLPRESESLEMRWEEKPSSFEWLRVGIAHLSSIKSKKSGWECYLEYESASPVSQRDNCCYEAGR